MFSHNEFLLHFVSVECQPTIRDSTLGKCAEEFVPETLLSGVLRRENQHFSLYFKQDQVLALKIYNFFLYS